MYSDSREKVENGISNSVRAIRKIEYTVIPKLLNGNLIEVESKKDEISQMLDKQACIDYFREDGHGMQGIASRVQFAYKYKTFTIRTERESGNITELEKNLYAIEHGYLNSVFTLQAYFDNSVDLNLYSIAIIKTVDLYGYYKLHPTEFLEKQSNAKFIYIEWERLKEQNVDIRIYLEAEKNKYIDMPF